MRYMIDYKNPEKASTVQWISEDFEIADFEPYIESIICDHGDEYEELWGGDEEFTVISLDEFSAKKGDGDDTYILCYRAVVEIDINKFPRFKEALEFSSNHVEIKIGFKFLDGENVDEEVCEGYSDIPVELKGLVTYGSKSGVSRYFINHDKARDACSILWKCNQYMVNELTPYIYAIECVDGEGIHQLINSEWPASKGSDDFKALELNNFAAVDGDEDKEYLLCFNALIETDLNKHSEFKKALERSGNQVVARIQFKKNEKPIIDEDGCEELLYEMVSDVFVDLELDD